MVVLPEVDYVLGSITSDLLFLFVFRAFRFVVFFVYLEALELTISLSFRNLVFRSCSTYIWIKTPSFIAKNIF